jgi:hypothetical protein
MLGSSPRGIFLSYRREDAGPYARLLQIELRERMPTAQVFMDVDSIDAGLDFAKVIAEAIDSCAVLLALIGRQWATITDDEGRRRLDDPDDLVRFEVQAALERGVRVIPVLVDGARPLRRQQLPHELSTLARLNAFDLSYERYQYDAERLLGLIQRVLSGGSDLPSTNEAAGKDSEHARADFPKGAGTSQRGEEDKVPVHVVYYGERAEGIFHPSTSLIDIVSGPGSKATGLKPSPAAGEVIMAVNKDRGAMGTGSRNGWGFWIVNATGKRLQSVRHKHVSRPSS